MISKRNIKIKNFLLSITSQQNKHPFDTIPELIAYIVGYLKGISLYDIPGFTLWLSKKTEIPVYQLEWRLWIIKNIESKEKLHLLFLEFFDNNKMFEELSSPVAELPVCEGWTIEQPYGA